MYVADHASKFEEVYILYPHYNSEVAKGSKCVKFESGVLPEIKQFTGYRKIHHFSMLVNKCKIYDEDNIARSMHYKSVNKKKFGNHNRGKPYAIPIANGNKKVVTGNRNHGGYAFTPLRCEKCGKLGYNVSAWKDATPTCFNCREHGQISTYCYKSKNIQGISQHAQDNGKVLDLSGVEASGSYKLIHGTCFINGIPLIAIIDRGAPHLFVSQDCVNVINLEVPLWNLIWSLRHQPMILYPCC